MTIYWWEPVWKISYIVMQSVVYVHSLRTMGYRLTKKAAAAVTKAPVNVSAILCRRCLAEVRILALCRAADRAEGCRMSGHMASLATPRSSSSGTTVWAENYHNYNKNTFLDVSFLSSHIYHPPPICLWHKYRIVVSYFDGISSYVWLPLTYRSRFKSRGSAATHIG